MKLTIRYRLLIIVAATLLVAGGVGLVVQYSISEMSEGMEELVDEAVPELVAVVEIGSELNALLHLVAHDAEWHHRTEVMGESFTGGNEEEIHRGLNNALEGMRGALGVYEQFMEPESEQEILDQLEGQLSAIESTVKLIIDAYDDQRYATHDREQLHAQADEMLTLLDSLEQRERREVKEQSRVIREGVEEASKLIYLLLVAAAVTVFLLYLLLLRRILQGFSGLNGLVQQIEKEEWQQLSPQSGGDEFTEFGQLLSEVSVRLGETIQQRELLLSRERYVLEFISDAVVAIDIDSKIQLFNRAAEDLFGYSQGEIVGESVERLIPEEVRGGHAANVQRFAEGGVERMELTSRQTHTLLQGQRKDGSRFPARIGISRFHDGERWLFTAIIQDISAEQESEQREKEYLQEVERAVDRATMQLQEANKQLLRQGGELESRERQVSDFIRLSSHNLQEPARKIQLFAERYLSHHPGEELPEDLLRVVHSTEDVSLLADSIFRYAHILNDEIHPDHLDLGEVMEAVLSSLQPLVEENGAVVTMEMEGAVTGEPWMIRLLLEKVVDNAIRYHRPGQTPRVEISSSLVTRNSPAGRGRESGTEKAIVRIWVRDHGIGLPDEVRSKAAQFVSPLRGRGAIHGEGAGIGVSISLAIVQRHNGWMEYSDTEGGGTTVTIELPASLEGEGESAGKERVDQE